MDGEARVNVYLELKNRIKTGLDQAKQYLNKNVQEIKGKLNDLKTTHIEAFKAMENEIPGFGRAVALLKNPYVLLTAVVVGLATALSTASAKAQAFDERMAHANVTAQVSQPELKKIGNQLLDTAASSTTKGAVTAAPDAYNILLSSGMENATALAATAPALKAAKAGFTDIETTARAMASSMNSSGIQDANKVLDVLFATVNKGNAEFKDIAEYLPKLVPMAKTVGSSFEEISGAFAYFTAQGLSSMKTSTMLENALKTLADPDKANSFKKIGVDVYDAHGKLRGLYDIAMQLSKTLHGLTDKQRNTVMGSLGMDVESSAAFSILSNNVKDLKQDIDFTVQSAGQFKLAVETAKTPLDGWTQIGNAIEVQWVKLGQGVNSILGPLAYSVINIFDSIKQYLIDFNNSTGFFSNLWSGIVSIATTTWDVISGLGIALWGIIGPVVMWLAKSQIIKDLFWLIGQIAWSIGKILEGVGWSFKKIGEGLYWVFDHVIKPILDGIEWIYVKIKELLGVNSSNSKIKEAQNKLAEVSPTKNADVPKNLYERPNSKVQNVLDEEAKKEKKKERQSEGMTGSSQTKVITINKLSMIDGNFISTNDEFKGMSKADMERWLQEMFQRMMINLGRSYS